MAGATTITSTALLAALAFTSAAAQSSPAPTSHRHIIVDISGIENSRGELVISLYPSSESWLKSSQALRVIRVSPTPPSTQVVFTHIPAGTYAIGVLHDEDRNGKLSFRLLPWPRIEEFVGMSQNPSSNIGPPSFEQARFEHTDQDLQLGIRLQR